MKITALLLSIATLLSVHMNNQPSIYDIKINDHTGSPLDLNAYKGKKLMIVNVASECGYTSQYGALQELYDLHKDSLIIIGVPCNDFGGQEPGTEEEIVTFCQKKYGVTFPITEKIGITSDIHPLYQWLTEKEKNGISNNSVKWNFHKFLIDKDGSLYASLPSGVTPGDDVVLDWVAK